MPSYVSTSTLQSCAHEGVTLTLHALAEVKQHLHASSLVFAVQSMDQPMSHWSQMQHIVATDVRKEGTTAFIPATPYRTGLNVYGQCYFASTSYDMTCASFTF